ncbi:hypothetical protein KIPB_000547 [Kipferlia bialata]|uniref:Uncharacterized protein n=1 Tax=Kipferlia bialata TaxID=797122 RepID=A0A9K3GER9_9EUKA|nr:hypothetical protein KIPB_000547 [Kipferlia bialata]|eukprot:g547.t1
MADALRDIRFHKSPLDMPLESEREGDFARGLSPKHNREQSHLKPLLPDRYDIGNLYTETPGGLPPIGSQPSEQSRSYHAPSRDRKREGGRGEVSPAKRDRDREREKQIARDTTPKMMHRGSQLQRSASEVGSPTGGLLSGRERSAARTRPMSGRRERDRDREDKALKGPDPYAEFQNARDREGYGSAAEEAQAERERERAEEERAERQRQMQRMPPRQRLNDTRVPSVNTHQSSLDGTRDVINRLPDQPRIPRGLSHPLMSQGMHDTEGEGDGEGMGVEGGQYGRHPLSSAVRETGGTPETDRYPTREREREAVREVEVSDCGSEVIPGLCSFVSARKRPMTQEEQERERGRQQEVPYYAGPTEVRERQREMGWEEEKEEREAQWERESQGHSYMDRGAARVDLQREREREPRVQSPYQYNVHTVQREPRRQRGRQSGRDRLLAIEREKERRLRELDDLEEREREILEEERERERERAIERRMLEREREREREMVMSRSRVRDERGLPPVSYTVLTVKKDREGERRGGRSRLSRPGSRASRPGSRMSKPVSRAQSERSVTMSVSPERERGLDQTNLNTSTPVPQFVGPSNDRLSGGETPPVSDGEEEEEEDEMVLPDEGGAMETPLDEASPPAPPSPPPEQDETPHIPDDAKTEQITWETRSIAQEASVLRKRCVHCIYIYGIGMSNPLPVF